MKKFNLALIFLLLLCAPAFAYDFQLTASEDTFSDKCYATKNFGDSDKLWAGTTVNDATEKVDGTYFARSYLKFDLSSFNNIENAYVWLYAVDSDWNTRFPGQGIGHSNITVYRESESWNETTLTWHDAPNFYNNAQGPTVVVDEGSWYSWNVSTFAKNAQGGNLSLVFASNESANDPFSIFESSETLSGHAPFLGVNTVKVVPEPVSCALFLLGGGALAMIRRGKKA